MAAKKATPVKAVKATKKKAPSVPVKKKPAKAIPTTKAKKTKTKKSAGSKLPPLKLKQQLFAEAMLQGKSGVEAVAQAGYGGSRESQYVIASENLEKPQIRAYMRRRVEAQVASSNEVLALLADHLSTNLGEFAQFYDAKSGKFDLEKAYLSGYGHLIKKLKQKRLSVQVGEFAYEDTYEVELQLHDSQRAAAHLINVMGLKQQPGENQRDIERKKAVIKTEAARMEKEGFTPGEIREIIEEIDPAALEYLN